jgi:hypothetical protein
MTCIFCDKLSRCSNASNDHLCQEFVVDPSTDIRLELTRILGASALQVIKKSKEVKTMSNQQVTEIVNAVLAGHPSVVFELASDPSVAITHLMLACRDFCDPAEIARACTKVVPEKRRSIFIDCLLEAARKNSESQVAAPEPVQEVQEQPQPVKEAPSPRRRRSPAAAQPTLQVEERQPVVQEVVQVPVVEQVVVEQGVDVGEQVNALNSALVSISHNFSKLMASNSEILNRVSAIDAGVSTDLKYINAALDRAQRLDDDFYSKYAKDQTNVNQRLDEVVGRLEILVQNVEKFRAGTEALEIALISKGILDTAPFADSWNAK